MTWYSESLGLSLFFNDNGDDDDDDMDEDATFFTDKILPSICMSTPTNKTRNTPPT